MQSFSSENLRNKHWKRLFASPYFFALGIVLSLTFGLLMLGNFRAFKSDISILIIPKNESASFQAGQIMENLTDITHRLSFYDRVLFDNRDIQDPFVGLGKDQRKEKWNESFEIKRLAESTTLNISVFNKDKFEANRIARQMALTLSEVASRFYDIRTELEFRIIEGPISSPYVRDWPWLIASSVLAGFVLSFIVLAIFNSTAGKVRGKVIEKVSERDYFSPSASKTFAPKNLFREAPIRRASAPSNLPIAEEEAEKPVEIFASLEKDIPEEKGEPTDEEYRERLNKLLRGEI